jgi:multidrug efflux pump subunit AcrA (membrane-fusion protein)
MTATVDLNLAAIFGTTELDIKIPNTAVFTDPDGSKLVWVIDPESMTVHRQGVETGHLVDDRILIVSGLKLGDRIVTAGVHHLEEGQKVRLFTGTFGE